MSTLLCADFTLVKDGKTIWKGYSEHCCFVSAGSLTGTFEMNEFVLNDDQETRVSRFFGFSLESIDMDQWGSVVQLLTSSNIGCLIMFNGWWYIYVPVQFVHSLTLVH